MIGYVPFLLGLIANVQTPVLLFTILVIDAIVLEIFHVTVAPMIISLLYCVSLKTTSSLNESAEELEYNTVFWLLLTVEDPIVVRVVGLVN